MAKEQKITYCLWFNKEAEEVAKYYTTVFSNSKREGTMSNPIDTPSGKSGSVLTANFTIFGQSFMALNGGPEFHLNSSISFFIHSNSADEIDGLWQKLGESGKVLMPLDKYPFSDKYGWVQDKYGLSWQLILNNPKNEQRPRLMPSLLFVNNIYGKAEEAIHYYTSIFDDTKVGMMEKYPAGMEPDEEGKIMYADFMLADQWFAIMESAREHNFDFNEALSFVVHCQTQEEVDHFWYKLSGNGGSEIQCGWLKDKYGVVWQIVPDMLLKLVTGTDKEKAKRVMQAMMKMVKLDIKTLEEA
jgi:predicted 3-demethylubiquinone-9 3-methyltransferase (glyoxalase superfamily)